MNCIYHIQFHQETVTFLDYKQGNLLETLITAVHFAAVLLVAVFSLTEVVLFQKPGYTV